MATVKIYYRATLRSALLGPLQAPKLWRASRGFRNFAGERTPVKLVGRQEVQFRTEL